MARSAFQAMMITAVAAGGLFVAPATAQAGTAGGPSRSAVIGAGQFRLDEPGTAGDRIWFGVQASSAADGSVRGRFQFRHARPDGTVVGSGWAEVTCLRVDGNTALFTAVVPEEMPSDPVRNHAFAVKIIDGGRSPDVIASIQAQNGAERPPGDCFDFDVDYPGVPRYPVLSGGYLVHGA